MRKFIVMVGAAIGMFIASPSVQAADMYNPNSVRMVVQDFVTTRNTLQGFYVGGHYSYNRDNSLGAFAGYNFDFNNVIVGAETDFSYNVNHIRSNWDGSTRVRLGYNINGFVPYVTTGMAYKNEFNRAHIGYTVGTGLEYHINNWFTRAEYRYTRFNTALFRDDHSGRVGIGYRF